MRVDGEEIIITAENAEEAIDNAVINMLKDLRQKIEEEKKEFSIYDKQERDVLYGLQLALDIIDEHIGGETKSEVRE